MQRLRVLVRKEFLELRQDPRLFGLVVVAPIMQLTMLGYAATTDVHDVPVVVADGDRTSASRELAGRFDASRNFSIIDTVTTTAEIEPYLEEGRAWLALAIPAGYGADVRAHRPVTVQVIADGTDSNSTTVALGYATSLIGGYAQELAEAGPASGAEAPGPPAGRPAWLDRRADAGLVQSAAREPALHDSRRARARPAGRHREPRGDGHRAREGAGHARTAQRDAAAALGADCRQAPAVRRDRDDRRRARGRRGGVLVRGAAAGELRAVAGDEPALRVLHALARAAHLDDLGDAAAGDDDRDVLLPHADDLPLGVHLPDREHAGDHPAVHLSDSAALLPGDRSRDLSEGHRAGAVMAPGGGARRLGVVVLSLAVSRSRKRAA